MASTIALAGEHILAATNERTAHTVTGELVRLLPPTLEGKEGIFIKVSDNDNVAKPLYQDVSYVIDGLMDATIYESQQDVSYGIVSTHYDSGAADLVVFIDLNCDYIPVERDVFAIATDHIGTALDYGQIQTVTGTNPYTITPENTFPVSYRLGSPIVFNMRPKYPGCYLRQYEGIGNQRARPAAITVGGAWAAAMTWSAVVDLAVLYNGSIWIYVSDTPFNPRDWRRIDGLYPDKIVASSLITTPSPTTMNGGMPIGTGTRYACITACANLTVAESAMAAGQKGPFGAILGPINNYPGTVS